MLLNRGSARLFSASSECDESDSSNNNEDSLVHD